jgi:hypothetical protein
VESLRLLALLPSTQEIRCDLGDAVVRPTEGNDVIPFVGVGQCFVIDAGTRRGWYGDLMYPSLSQKPSTPEVLYPLYR